MRRPRLLTCLLIALALTAVTAAYAIRRTVDYRGAITAHTNLQKARSQDTGGISGRVVDLDGHTVAYADVEAFTSPPGMGLVPSARSDSDGLFTLEDLEVGKYNLFVSKEESGYPSTWNRFYSAGFVEVSEVIVYAGQTVPWGDVRLGPKAGKLVGTVRDAKTNKAILFSSPTQPWPLTLCRVDYPKNCAAAFPNKNGDFEALVPPAPFTIETTAPGFEKKDLGPLSLKRGEIRRFDILLTPTR